MHPLQIALYSLPLVVSWISEGNRRGEQNAILQDWERYILDVVEQELYLTLQLALILQLLEEAEEAFQLDLDELQARTEELRGILDALGNGARGESALVRAQIAAVEDRLRDRRRRHLNRKRDLLNTQTILRVEYEFVLEQCRRMEVSFQRRFNASQADLQHTRQMLLTSLGLALAQNRFGGPPREPSGGIATGSHFSARHFGALPSLLNIGNEDTVMARLNVGPEMFERFYA